MKVLFCLIVLTDNWFLEINNLKQYNKLKNRLINVIGFFYLRLKKIVIITRKF